MKRTKRFAWLIDTFVDLDTKNQFYVPGASTQSLLMAIAVGTFAAVGGFLYGYDTGLLNNVLLMDFVRENFSKNGVNFSLSERALATASLSLGTLFGSICSPLLSDIWGRKKAIFFAALVVFNVGNICQVTSTTLALLCVGRTITGTAIGVLSAVVPLYQSEASPKWVRGAIVSTYQWAITWGFLCSSAISQGTYKKRDSSSYRIPIGLQSGWSLILSFGLFFLPESPRFYVMKDKILQAAHALGILRRVPEDDPGLIEELVDIKATHDYELSVTAYSYLECFRSGRGRSKQGLRMLTGICLQAFQQATGINFIFYYGVWFFVRSGVVNQSYLFSFITYAVNVVGTIPGILLIEIIGRRKILIYGGVGMTLSTFIIAIVGTVLQTSSLITNKIMMVFVCIFIFFFASTWGPAVWVITSEIFPLGVRGRSVSLSAATNWLFNFGFAFLSPYLISTSEDSTIALESKIFFLWGGLNFCGTVFSYFAVYETKGLRLEEIDEMYKTCSSARVSTKFVSRHDGGHDGERFARIREGITNQVSHLHSETSNLPNSKSPSNIDTSATISETEPKSYVELLGDGNMKAYEGNAVTSVSTTSSTRQQYSTTTGPEDIASVPPAHFPPGSHMDIGYGLQVNGVYRNGAPSLSEDSSSSLDENLDNIHGTNLREYVSNLQAHFQTTSVGSNSDSNDERLGNVDERDAGVGGDSNTNEGNNDGGH